MVRRMLLVLFVTFALGLAAPGVVQGAQEASPQSGPACDVTPQAVDELIALAFPQGTPAAMTTEAFVALAEGDLPAGELVDAATAAVADQAVQAWVVCQVAGETARLHALMTDKLDAVYLQRLITHPASDTIEELRRVLESGMSGTLVVGSTAALATVGREVRMLDDGRIGGIWTVDGNDAFIILAEEDGAWLLDEIIDVLDEGTPVAGTPAA